MQVKVTQLDEKNINIERIFNDGKSAKFDYAAQFHATGNENSNIVTISTEHRPFSAISVAPSDLEINGVVPVSVESAVTALNEFIGNFNSGGASSSTTDIILSVIKSGINGEITPSAFSWITGLSVKEVRLMSNAAGISFQIGENTYDAETIIDVEIPAETELLITDVEIEAGNNQANVIIIFKKLTS